MAIPDLRFSSGDIHAVLAQQSDAVAEAVRTLPADLVLSTPVEDLADDLHKQFRIEPIVLHLERRTSTGAKDITLTVDSWTGDRVKVDGTRVEVLVPFEGDAVLFDVRASTFNYNPPHFNIRGDSVVAAFEGRAPLDKNQAKASIERLIQGIEQHLHWQRNDIDPWNERLSQHLPQQIEARRKKILHDRELDEFLEVPIVGRVNPFPSFTVDPPKRPRPVAITEEATAAGFMPEPAISEEGLTAILAEIESVTTAVQRLPRTFVEMPEESLRDVLLVVLNNRFGPSSGETFSRRGKTDIFVPWGGDQRAVFIAECKWWKGPAAFRKAIDQLLGYMVWRDSRAAIIIFVGTGEPSAIAEKAAAEVQSHDSFKRMQAIAGRPAFTLANRDDPRRELRLVLLLIPVLP